MPATELLWLDLPGPGRPGVGAGISPSGGPSPSPSPSLDLGRDVSPALVTVRVGNREYQWPGVLRRTLGEVEPLGRMTQVVIEVADLYGLEQAQPSPITLLPGLFVGVELTGALLPDVFTIPRRVLKFFSLR